MMKFATIDRAQRYADSGIHRLGRGFNEPLGRPRVLRSQDGGIYVAPRSEAPGRGDEIIPPDASVVVCGVCGAEDWMCPRVEESWHPSAYRGDEEVSPVCPKHPGHYDASEQAFIVEE